MAVLGKPFEAARKPLAAEHLRGQWKLRLSVLLLCNEPVWSAPHPSPVKKQSKNHCSFIHVVHSAGIFVCLCACAPTPVCETGSYFTFSVICSVQAYKYGISSYATSVTLIKPDLCRAGEWSSKTTKDKLHLVPKSLIDKSLWVTVEALLALCWLSSALLCSLSFSGRLHLRCIIHLAGIFAAVFFLLSLTLALSLSAALVLQCFLQAALL